MIEVILGAAIGGAISIAVELFLIWLVFIKEH